MKITFKTSTSARDGISRFPTLRIPLDRCFAADGKPIRIALFNALSCADETVQIGSNDDLCVLQVGATFLAEIEERMRSIEECASGDVVVQEGYEIAHPKGSAERKMNRGQNAICTVRITYRSTSESVLMRISYGRGKSIRDDKAYEYAKDLAILLAQCAFTVRDGFAGSPVKVIVADDEGCEGLCEAAVRDALWRIECKRIDEANAARLKCEHLFGWEWCKGCKKDCPNWVAGGKCADIVKPEMPRIHE